MDTIWKDVLDYEGLYEVSNTGLIRSKKKLLKLTLRSDGYVRCSLFKNKKMKAYYVHRVVAKSFISNPGNLPEVNHKDGDKSNNNDWNLEWCTKIYNALHSFKIGLQNNKGENHPRSKFTNEQIFIIKSLLKTKKYTQLEIANMYNVSRVTINSIKNERNWKTIKKDT